MSSFTILGDGCGCSPYGTYNTNSFADIFENYEEFRTQFRDNPLQTDEFTDESLSTLYYELYARYGNSHISNSDENQFKFQVFSIIRNKGLIWQRNVYIQKKLRQLKDEEILKIDQTIFNHATNPGRGGRTTVNGDVVLDYINSQETHTRKGSPLVALTTYMQSMEDVTEKFIAEFAKLFRIIAEPDGPLFYKEEKQK